MFTAILAVLHRHQKLHTYHWTGVSVTVLGIVIVRLSAILDEASGDIYSSVRLAFIRIQIVAMGVLVTAQAPKAFQTVVEEHLLHDLSATSSELCAFN
jgi:drug/metabolite transporter (DMT)-like permease